MSIGGVCPQPAAWGGKRQRAPLPIVSCDYFQHSRVRGRHVPSKCRPYQTLCIRPIEMLFAVIPLALVGAKSLLVAQPLRALAASSALLAGLQAARGVFGFGVDAYSALLTAALSVLVTPLVFGALVLLGSPVTTHLLETALLALLLSTLVIQPLLTVHGFDADFWLDLVSFKLDPTELACSSWTALLGAWIGVIPLALDWDRPWQAYPITIVLGSYMGYAVGAVIGFLLEKVYAPPKPTRLKAE